MNPDGYVDQLEVHASLPLELQIMISFFLQNLPLPVHIVDFFSKQKWNFICEQICVFVFSCVVFVLDYPLIPFHIKDK